MLILGLVVDHVPALTGCVNVDDEPRHTVCVPPIGAGAGVTVTTDVP